MPAAASTYRVRVEGVNLANFVDDVQDLSTVRGGGLLMLDVPRRLGNVAKQCRLEVTPISEGASSGLFSISGDATEISAFELAAAKELTSGGLEHATIVFDLLPSSDDFLLDRESLIALNRFSQMASPSVAVPAAAKTDRACAIDLVRPATTTTTKGTDTKDVSKSVKVRSDYGRKQKRDFYLAEISRGRTAKSAASAVTGEGFVHELEELTHNPSKGSLHHKMAVIYLDGNRFGQVQNDLCTSQGDQRDFDTTLRGYRTSALEHLLAAMNGDPEWRYEKTGPYQLETLLWGGDEMIWVVPAWQGWRVVQLFYETSAEWDFRKAPLTHAGGIVFCHRKATIHRVKQLAHDLAEKAKAVAKNATDGDRARRNVFAYQVLESFDYLGRDLDEFRKTRIPLGANVQDLVLSAATIAGIDSAFVKLKRLFPRSKLHDIVRGLRFHATSDETRELIRSTVDDAFTDETREHFDLVMKCFGPGETAWFHIAELWDYIQPPKQTGRTEVMP